MATTQLREHERGSGADSGSPPGGKAKRPRNHHLDAIRVSAILLLIPYHAARFLQKGPDDRRIIDAGVWFVHTWHMPLFMAISGCLASAALVRSTAARQIRGRTRRLLLPLAIGMVTIIPISQLLVILLAKLYRPPSAIPADRQLELGNVFSEHPNHLWFIDYLFVISVLAIGAWALLRRRPEIGAAAGAAYTALVRSPLLIPVLSVISTLILLTKKGWVTGGLMASSLIPKPSYLAYFALFFLFGWMLGTRQELIERFKRPAWLWLAVALAMAIPGYLLFYDNHAFTGKNGVPGALIDHPDLRPLGLLVFSTVCWLTLLGIWGVLARYVHSGSRAMRYVSDASFWIYLIHIPILIVWQTSLAQTEYPMPFRYAVTILGTTAVALGVYALTRKVRRSMVRSA